MTLQDDLITEFREWCFGGWRSEQLENTFVINGETRITLIQNISRKLLAQGRNCVGPFFLFSMIFIESEIEKTRHDFDIKKEERHRMMVKYREKEVFATTLLLKRNEKGIAFDLCSYNKNA